MTATALPAPFRAPPKAEPVLRRLWALHPKVIDLSLERIERLLAALGRPQDRLPPVIHVAGTNGKGSVVAFLRAFFEAAGYRAHVYTSPHLVRFNERIRLAGALITDDELYDLLSECEAANRGLPITFFEITTAAAFLAFARRPAEVTLLETGLGGRLDATNVVARPLATVITPISIDHTQFLGETAAQIAAEKAGILKPGVPAVIAPQPPEAAEVIAARAQALAAPLSRFGTEWTAAATPSGMRWRSAGEAVDLPRPALAGAHQVDNAATAIACARALPSLRPDWGAIRRGLETVEWPARLQRLSRGPLVEIAEGAGCELWLDGGHNPGAGEVLAAVARQWQEKPLRLVFGMLATKDGLGFLRPLAPFVEEVRAVPVAGEHATLSAGEAAALAVQAGHRAAPAASLAEAVSALARSGPARILICGSLYLAGNVLAEHG